MGSEDINRMVAETDIIAFIDEAICDAGAFGYGASREAEQGEAMSAVMNYLEQIDLDNKQLMQVEPLLSDLVLISEKEAFKRGFHIALRIMIDGLNAGNR